MTIIATLLCGYFLVIAGTVVLSALSSSYRGELTPVLLSLVHSLPFAFAVFALHSRAKPWKMWVTVALFVPFFVVGLWSIAKLSLHPSYSGGLLWSSITVGLPLFIVAAVVVRSRRQREGLVSASLVDAERRNPEAKSQRP